MARLLQNEKTRVDLAPPALRVSRIRRDPVPSAKEPSAADIREQDSRGAIIGMTAFALAMFVILVGFMEAADPSTSQSRTPITLRM